VSDRDIVTERRRRPRWTNLLLIAPYVAVLWVPFYSSVEPQLAGIPFFYWYQFLWILISAVLTFLAYLTGE
jgi:hypothetical protein